MKYTYRIAIIQKDPLIEKIEKRYNPSYIKKLMIYGFKNFVMVN